MGRDARRQRSPRFDALETRQVLSTVAGAHHAAMAQAKAATQPTPSAFLTADSQSTSHGAGGREVLKTTYSGSANNVGPAKATSTEVAVNNHLVSVQVLLQTAHGSVRLAFAQSDVTQNLADTYGTEVQANYHIVSGSGVFAHETGTGTVTFWTLGTNSGWNLTITPNSPA